MSQEEKKKEEEQKGGKIPGITLRKVNNVKVEPLKASQKSDDRPVLGEQLFPTCYKNVGIIAKKKSGKSVVLSQIVRETAGPKTIVLVFCSTIHKDPTYLSLKKWCEKKKIAFKGHTSIYEVDPNSKNKRKIDILASLMNQLSHEEEDSLSDSTSESMFDSEDESESEEDDRAWKKDRYGGRDVYGRDVKEISSEDEEKERREDAMFGSGIIAPPRVVFKERERQRKKQTPYIAPEFIIIFDDLSDELKTPSVVSLLKKHRHYKSAVYIASQYICDLKPEMLQQLDYCIIFKGIDEKKILKVYKECALNIPYEVFLKLYKDAVKEPYSFLYIDTREMLFRKRFDRQYMLPEYN